MWTWPLDSAMGAIAAHRAPERVANGMCIQVWAWMTNKCRRMMNEGEGYITTKISQKRKKKEERERRRGKALGRREELGIHILGWGVLSPWDVGPSDFVFLAFIWSSSVPKQAVALSEPNFWTHSLQIHCNGFAGLRCLPLLGPVRKPWPYIYIYIVLFGNLPLKLPLL